MTKYKIHIFKSPENGQWYLHIKARNGEIVLQSEGYKSHQSALKLANRLQAGALFVLDSAPVAEVSP
jgi:uncharacterized protein YegP (UPF0339 family)